MKKKTKENASEGLNSDSYAEKLKRIIFDNFDKKDIIYEEKENEIYH